MSNVTKKCTKRKEKSLQTLSEKFLKSYENENDGTLLKLDETATALGVEKRRIYDIVGVFESVGILQKKAVSCYKWKGVPNLNDTLASMKNEAHRDGSLKCGIERLPLENKHQGLRKCVAKFSHELTTAVDTDDDAYDEEDSKSKKKREKALAQLSKRLVQLFLVSELEEISYNQAIAVLIHSDSTVKESTLRTKTRRLYDIANILSSINLIKRINTFQGAKETAFLWTYSKKPASFSATDRSEQDSESSSSITTTTTTTTAAPMQPRRAPKQSSKKKMYTTKQEAIMEEEDSSVDTLPILNHASSKSAQPAPITTRELSPNSMLPPQTRSRTRAWQQLTAPQQSEIGATLGMGATPTKQQAVPLKKRKTVRSTIYPSPDVENTPPIYQFARDSPTKAKKRRRRSSSDATETLNNTVNLGTNSTRSHETITTTSTISAPLTGAPTISMNTPAQRKSKLQTLLSPHVKLFHFQFGSPKYSKIPLGDVTNSPQKEMPHQE